jgi:PKD repeat protein
MNGTTWTEIYGGDGMDCFIDRTNNNTIYGSYVYGEYYRSTDGGTNWTAITTGIPNGTNSQEWLSTWHQDPVTAATIYAAGRPAMYKSTNSGTNWAAVGTPTGTGNILEFEIAPSNNQIIYALKTGSNAVSKSVNGGASFTSVSTGLPTTVSPTDVAISNTNPNIVYVTYSGYTAASKVYKSIDGGTSWTNISTGLPNIPCNTVVYSNGNANNAIYVGTDVGVYYKDNTTSWIMFNTGLPNVSVSDLEIYYPTNRLRAATFGRGTWDSDLYSAVAAVPVASFTASSTTICAGQTVTFTNTSTGLPTSYNWTFAGGTPGTSTATNPTITYNTVGTFAVDLTATNASGSNTSSQPNYITVISATGIALPLNEGFVSTTFPPTNWTIYNPDLSATTWARSPTVGFAPTAGNCMFFNNLSYNDIGNNDEARTPKLNFTSLSSAQMTFDVAYAAYDASNFDGLSILVSTDCGLTYTSVYSKTGSNVAAGNLPTAPPTTGSFVPSTAQWRTETISLNSYIGQSNVTIAIRNLAGYGNNLYVDNINITGVAVVAAPVASFTSSLGSPVCTGQVVTYTSTSTNSPTSYSWTFAGGTPATSTSSTQAVTYATAGTYNVSLTATNASGSNTLNSAGYMTVITAPTTPGLVTGTATLCSGAAGNVYSIVAVAGATSYTWTVPAGATITAGQGTISATVTMGTTSGNITVTASNACGASAASTLAITITSIPVTPGLISGLATACSGAAGNVYSIVAVPGATSYTWTVPAGATITAGQGTISATVAMGATSGNVTVTATNVCGTSAASFKAITISSAPVTPGVISGIASLCSGAVGNNYSIVAVPGATSYTWTVPAGATITSGQGTISATVTMGSTSGNVTVTASNSCGTSTASIKVITIISSPSTPGVITGTVTLCSGVAGNIYSIVAVPGATSYTWTVPSGSTITSGQGTTSATVTMGSTSGNVTVTATNTCGTSAASVKAIAINTLPAVPGIIAGSVIACSGSVGNVYSIAAVAGATSYSWTVPAGATITSGQGTISATVTMGSTSGNVTVTATNTCGTSAASVKAITINTLPAVPGIIAGSVIACSGSIGNVYSIAAVAGATSYTWTVPVGATITAGQGTISATVTMGATFGNITVTATNTCGTSAARSLAVTINNAAPATPGLISGTITPCSGSSGNIYSIVAVSGATNYTWTVPVGATITGGQGTISATITMGITSGNITVIASSSCGASAASSLTVTIDIAPANPTILIDDNCGYSVLTTSSTESLLWSTGETTNSITVLIGGSYTLTASNGLCTSGLNAAIASPSLIPIVSFDAIQDVCINAPLFDLTGGIPSGGIYNGLGVTSNQFNPSVSGYGTFMIDYTYSDVNGCSASSQQSVTVGCAEITETEINSISVFPNPSNGLFSVLTEGLKVESIRIYDATGKLVKLVLNSNNSKELKIDLTDCSEGIYTIEITSNVSVTRDRVIVVN